jgi:hypothetical protein
MDITIHENHILVKRIWDHVSYCAFTDLIYFKDTWYCTFRESDAHQNGRNGTIRIIASKDTNHWQTVGYFSEPGVDLRDPKLSQTPDGRLMLLCGGTIYQKEEGKGDRMLAVSLAFLFPLLGKNGHLLR